MSGLLAYVLEPPLARFSYGGHYPVTSATVTLGPVADTAEPVAAEARRPIPEPDRDDTHTVGHG